MNELICVLVGIIVIVVVGFISYICVEYGPSIARFISSFITWHKR